MPKWVRRSFWDTFRYVCRKTLPGGKFVIRKKRKNRKENYLLMKAFANGKQFGLHEMIYLESWETSSSSVKSGDKNLSVRQHLLMSAGTFLLPRTRGRGIRIPPGRVNSSAHPLLLLPPPASQVPESHLRSEPVQAVVRWSMLQGDSIFPLWFREVVIRLDDTN